MQYSDQGTCIYVVFGTSVSIDLIMKSLLALGASPKDVAKAIFPGVSHAA